MNTTLSCKYCKHDIEVPIKWAIQNGRIFCNFCVKAFDVNIKVEENEEEKENLADNELFEL